jgi:hypothetical protein
VSEYHVVVLGGYGHYGNRICHALAEDARIRLTVGGRDAEAASKAASALAGGAGRHTALALDVLGRDLAMDLRRIRADLVIHTCGPFQGQSYQVAEACLDAGCDYIDLADGREFVADFHGLDARAQQAGRTLITGASTLPGISSAVIAAHVAAFRRLATVRMGITPGQRTPRGLATIASILGYCGRGFAQLERGKWVRRHGWQDLRRLPHPTLGPRYWGACDVPDLELFPACWPALESVSFHAGLELRSLQLGLWLASWVRRARLISDWSRHAGWVKRTADHFDRFGSEDGGMFIHMEGEGANGARLEVRWWLTARQGHGPFIPCVPAVVLARKLAAGERVGEGARPCLGLFTLTDVKEALGDLAIDWEVQRT